MPTTKDPAARFKPEAQLAKAQADLADAQRLHAHAALRHAQGDASALAEVEALEREISTHTTAIARLQAALTVTGHVQTAAEREQIAALEVQRLADAERLASEIEATVTEVIRVFDDLAPLLAKLDRLSDERSTVTRSLLHTRFKFDDRRLDGFRARLGLARPGSVLLAAIKTCGLGRIGPRLEPYLIVDATRTGTPEQSIAELHSNHAKEQLALLEATGRLPKPEPTPATTVTEEVTQ